MNICEFLTEISETSSRNEKISLLAKHKDNEVLKCVVFQALDPFTSFYQRKIPSYVTARPGWHTLATALPKLDKMSNREITGNAAIEYLSWLLSEVSPDDAKVLERIVQKDLKCGVNESTANKVWPGLIAEFPYMRCCLPKDAKLSKWNWKAGVFSQLKADGMFANVNHTSDGLVSILTRSGNEFPMEQFAALSESISSTLKRGTQSHGEVLVKVDGKIAPREIGNGIINSVLKGGSFESNEEPTLLMWDQIPLSAVVPGGEYNVPFYERFNDLSSQVIDSPLLSLVPTRIVHSMEEAMTHYGEMLAAGFEGTILKERNAIWKDTTSKFQVKLKLDVDVDLKIVGFTAGKGKNAATFGAVTVETCDGLLRVNVSGFKDKKAHGVLTRAEISEMRDQLMDTIMTVKSNNLMPPTKTNPVWSLFLPRAVEFRSDKTEADSLQKVQDQFANAVKIK